MREAANFFAKYRSLFEYPRTRYGSYNDFEHVKNIVNGYLGEFAFLEYIYNYLQLQYGELNQELRYSLLESKNFKYNLIVGKTDPGYDFIKDNLTIDVKNYGTQIINIQNVLKMNLLIDERQVVNKQGASFYIQTFVLDTNEIALAGFFKGLPPLNYNFPQPAYASKVVDLEPMSQIFNALRL